MVSRFACGARFSIRHLYRQVSIYEHETSTLFGLPRDELGLMLYILSRQNATGDQALDIPGESHSDSTLYCKGQNRSDHRESSARC